MMHVIGLEIDEPVDVREEQGKIVIEPLHRKAYDLNDLLKGINPRNLHEAVDFGAPIGKEAW